MRPIQMKLIQGTVLGQWVGATKKSPHGQWDTDAWVYGCPLQRTA